MGPEATIVHLAAHRESDRIVECLSAEGGRRRYFAPAARRSRRRFGGGLDLFSRVRLVLAAGVRRAPGGMPTLAAAELVDARDGLRASLEGVVVAGLSCRALRAMVPLEAGGPEGRGTWHALEVALDAAAGGATWPAALAFLPILCRAQGLLPAVTCARCGGAAEGGGVGVVPGAVVHLACLPRAQPVPAMVPALLAGEVPRHREAARALVFALRVLTHESAPGALAARPGLDDVLWPSPKS